MTISSNLIAIPQGEDVNKWYIDAGFGESFKITGKVIVDILGEAEIIDEHGKTFHIKEEKAKSKGDSSKSKEEKIKRFIKLNENETVTITCKTEKKWEFTIEGREPFICDDNNDYAIISRWKKDKKYIHLLFGTKLMATELAVEYLLKHHDELPLDDNYFLIIHVRCGDSRALFDRDADKNIVITDCTKDFFK